jgi:hypothetical protein
VVTFSKTAHCSSKDKEEHSFFTFILAGCPILTQSSTKWLINHQKKAESSIQKQIERWIATAGAENLGASLDLQGVVCAILE